MTLEQAITKYSGVASELQSGTVSLRISEEAFLQLAPELKQVALNAASIAGLGLSPSDAAAFAAFVDTYTADNIGLVSLFRLYGKDESWLAGTPSEGVESGMPEMTPENVENWVREGFEIQSQDNLTGKVFDGRDSDVDTTVRKMQGVLLFGSDEGSRAAARSKYGPIIGQFIGGTLAEGPASEKLQQWAQAILNAWVAHCRVRFPEIGVKTLRSFL